VTGDWSQTLQTVTCFLQISCTPVCSPHGHFSLRLTTFQVFPHHHCFVWPVPLHHAPFHNPSPRIGQRWPPCSWCRPWHRHDSYQCLLSGSMPAWYLYTTTSPTWMVQHRPRLTARSVLLCHILPLPSPVASDCHLGSGASPCADLVPPWLNQAALVDKP
jgi:hypothetical protein